jgi:hypothetical protein
MPRASRAAPQVVVPRTYFPQALQRLGHALVVHALDRTADPRPTAACASPCSGSCAATGPTARAAPTPSPLQGDRITDQQVVDLHTADY